MQEINTLIKHGGLDNIKRQLIVNPEYLQFKDTDAYDSPPTRFEKNEIVEYRYRMKWITGFYFTVGREYQVFIRNDKGKQLKINSKSFYGIRKNELHQLFNDITDRLWNFYFYDITDNFLKRIGDGEDIEVCNTIISKHGLILRSVSILKEQNKFIEWGNVGTKDYHTYFAIFDLTNASKTNASYYYINDWNVGVLCVLIKSILDQMKRETQ